MNLLKMRKNIARNTPNKFSVIVTMREADRAGDALSTLVHGKAMPWRKRMMIKHGDNVKCTTVHYTNLFDGRYKYTFEVELWNL